MELPIDLKPAELEQRQEEALPLDGTQPGQGGDPIGQHRAAFVAVALFSFGMSAFALLERRPSPNGDLEAPAPDPGVSPIAGSEAAQPLLTPLSTERAAAPNEEALLPLLLRESVPPAEFDFQSKAQPAGRSPLLPLQDSQAAWSLGLDAPAKSLRLLESLTGMFRYHERIPGQLALASMAQPTGEVWIMAPRPPNEAPAPKTGVTEVRDLVVAEGPEAAVPAAPQAPAPRRARVFRSSTRGVAAAAPVASQRSSFAAAPAAPAGLQQSAAGAIAGGGLLVTEGEHAASRAAAPAWEPGRIAAQARRGAAVAAVAGPGLAARRAAAAAPVPAANPSPNAGWALRALDGSEVRLARDMSLLDLQKGEAEIMARNAGVLAGKKVVGWTAKCLDMSCKNAGPSVEVRYSDGTKEDLKFDPLVLDLAGSGFKTGSATVEVDLTGSGKPETVNDLPPGSGLLVFGTRSAGASAALGMFGGASDVDGDGKPDGYGDGFAALAALARRASREGIIGGKAVQEGRLGPVELEALGKAYGLAIRVGSFASPARSLASAGVREIRLAAARSSRRENAFDGQGNDITRRPGATFVRADGSTGEYADLWLTSRKLKRVTLAKSR